MEKKNSHERVNLIDQSNLETIDSVLDEVGPTVEILLKLGRKLAKRDLNGYSDPYITFKAGESKKKSRIVKKNLNPIWDQKIILPVSPKHLKRHGTLTIECWDHDLISKDDFMGSLSISLKKLKNNVTYKYSEKLLEVESGLLEFEITPKNFEVLSYGTFREEPTAILEKLNNSLHHQNSSSSTKNYLAKTLSNSLLLKEKYLSMTWTDSISVHKSVYESLDLNMDEEDLELVQALMDESKAELDTEVKIKIIIVDQMKGSNFQQEMRKIISPIVSDLNITNIGLFHTALLIGPWLIEWNDSGLCIPRKCLSRSAFLTIDIGDIKTMENLESVRDKISDVIVYWNANVQYTSFGKSTKGQGNCQEFIESILHALNMNLQYDGAIGEFLQNMKKNGSSKLMFLMNKEFRKKFGITETSIEFKTHSQLDKFVKELDDKDVYFEDSYPDEYLLLKSFDRAFWLKHLKISKDAKRLFRMVTTDLSGDEQRKQKSMNALEQLEKDGEITKPYIDDLKSSNTDFEGHKCPFGDPIENKSFWL
eukprot:gene9489-1695_t